MYKLSNIGVRKPQYKYNTRNMISYLVLGEFIPNRLTTNANANKYLEIFRCKMNDTKNAYKNLSHSSKQVLIEILIENYSLINYTIPWKTLKTGYMLTIPKINNSNNNSLYIPS